MIERGIVSRVFAEHELNFARMMGSKTGYIKSHPDNQIVFNARVYDEETYQRFKATDILDFFKGQEHESWYGDLDLTLDGGTLKDISTELGMPLIITDESGNLMKKVTPAQDKDYFPRYQMKFEEDGGNSGEFVLLKYGDEVYRGKSIWPCFEIMSNDEQFVRECIMSRLNLEARMLRDD